MVVYLHVCDFSLRVRVHARARVKWSTVNCSDTLRLPTDLPFAGVLMRSVIVPFYLQCNTRFAKPSNHTIDDGKGAATTPRIKLLNHGDGVISAQYYFNV